MEVIGPFRSPLNRDLKWQTALSAACLQVTVQIYVGGRSIEWELAVCSHAHVMFAIRLPDCGDVDTDVT